MLPICLLHASYTASADVVTYYTLLIYYIVLTCYTEYTLLICHIVPTCYIVSIYYIIIASGLITRISYQFLVKILIDFCYYYIPLQPALDNMNQPGYRLVPKILHNLLNTFGNCLPL